MSRWWASHSWIKIACCVCVHLCGFVFWDTNKIGSYQVSVFVHDCNTRCGSEKSGILTIDGAFNVYWQNVKAIWSPPWTDVWTIAFGRRYSTRHAGLDEWSSGEIFIATVFINQELFTDLNYPFHIIWSFLNLLSLLTWEFLTTFKTDNNINL